MGVDPYLIAPTLVLSIAQRLARVIVKGGQNEIPVDAGMQKMIDKQFSDLPAEYKNDLKLGKTLFEAKPTPDCPSGTRGRIAVYEMYAVDKEMQNIILKTPSEEEIYKLARKNGMLTMWEDALIKCAEGTVPLQEVHNFNTE